MASVEQATPITCPNARCKAMLAVRIDAIRALLAALNADIRQTTSDLLYMGTVSGSGPGTAMRSPATAGDGTIPGSGGGGGQTAADVQRGIVAGMHEFARQGGITIEIDRHRFGQAVEGALSDSGRSVL